MAKIEEEVKESKQPAMTTEQLLALLARIVENQEAGQQNLAEKLAAAVIEAKKPYLDPLQEENRKRAIQQEEEQRKRFKEREAYNQSVCPHVQGCLGDNPSLNKSSFVLHRMDTGATIGICTACQKVICSLNPEDAPLFQKARSGNRMSGAGVRTFSDPLKAQKDGFLDTK